MTASAPGAPAASLAMADRRLARTVRGIGVILAVLTLAGAGLSLWVGRGLELQRWRQTALDLSVAVAEHAAQSVHGADLELRGLVAPLNAQGLADAAALQRVALDPAMRETLRARIAGMPQVAGAAIVTSAGTVLCSTHDLTIATSDVADAAFFAMMERPDEAVYISRPLRNTESGAWVFFLLRQIRARDGHPLGGVVVAFRGGFLTDFFRSVSIGDGARLSLFRIDGMLMARYPEQDELLGRSFPDWISRLHAAPDGAAAQLRALRGPLIDGTPGGLRIVAVRRLLDYPLAMVFTITNETVLALWRSAAWWAGGIAAVLSAAVLVLSWLLAGMLDRRRMLIEELTQARAVAETAARSQGDFLAAMSHEIRTPMNAILGMNAMLLRTGLTREQRHYAGLIGEGAHALMRLLDDVLENARLEAGRVEIEALDFAPRPLAEGAVGMLVPQAEEKGLRLVCVVDPAVPAILRGDRARIRQVLINLLANAVKFTEKGSVALRVRPVAGEAGEMGVRFEVSDTGIGIPAEARERLFERFSQADQSISRRFGGSGLGLAICRQLVELMGGRIGVKSQIGVGSTFFFELPLRPVGTAEVVGTTEKLPPPDLVAVAAPEDAREAGLRVLLVDDDPLNRKVGMAMLSRLGHRVEMAVSGEAAVAAAREGGFGAVLMDVQMLGMDGLEATRRIRALPAPAGEVPILALSADMQPETEAQCREAGTDGWLGKPLEMDELARRLAAIAQAGRETAASPRRMPRRAAPPARQGSSFS